MSWAQGNTTLALAIGAQTRLKTITLHLESMKIVLKQYHMVKNDP